MIKVVAANVVMDVLDRAIQVHGSLGMSDDTPLAGMWRFSRMLKVADGPDEVHKMVVARRELNKAAKAAEQSAAPAPEPAAPSARCDRSTPAAERASVVGASRVRRRVRAHHPPRSFTFTDARPADAPSPVRRRELGEGATSRAAARSLSAALVQDA